MFRFLLLIIFSISIISETKFYVLGTGTPNPNPERGGSSYLVLVDQTPYVFDFGSGVVRQAASLTSTWSGENRFKVEDIEYAFLTHMHSDHTLGLSDLIITPWIMGRKNKLHLFGPKELDIMSKKIIEAYNFDINYRITGSQPQNPSGYMVAFTEIYDGYIFSNHHIKVEAFRNNHGDLHESYGFVIETEDKKIVISGDTAPSKNLLKKSIGADILVHEVYSSSGFKKKTDDWKIYHKAHHTSPEELSQIANKIKPKVLVLSHVLFWGSDSDEIINEIKDKYSGRVILPNDGDLIH